MTPMRAALLAFCCAIAPCASSATTEAANSADETPEAAPLRLKQEWQLAILSNRTGYRRDSPLDPARYSADRDASQGALMVTPTFRLALTPQIGAFLKAVASDGQGATRPNGTRGRILESFLSIADSDQIVRLIVGKQKVRWSQDSTFHPFDVFGKYNQPKSSIGLNEYDPYQQEATPLVRLLGSHGDINWDVVVAHASDNFLRGGARQAALKLSTTGEGAELSLMLEETTGHGRRTGLSLSKDIGADLGLYAEFVHAASRSLPTPQIVSPAVPVGPGLVLPAVYALSAAEPGHSANQSLLTLRRNLDGIATIETSYFRNGEGYSRDEWNRLATLAWRAESTYVDPAFRPIYPGRETNPHGGFLGSLATLTQHQYLRRQYLNLRVDTLENFSLARIEGNLIHSIDDHGTTLSLTLRKAVSGNALLNLFYVVSTGPADSEAALAPAKTSLGAYLQWNL